MADRWRDDDYRWSAYRDRDDRREFRGDNREEYARGNDWGGDRAGERGGGRFDDYDRYGSQGAGGRYYGGYAGGRDFGRGAGYDPYAGRRGWDDGRYGDSRDGRRDWMDRAGDEVASWFGDDDAERRRRMDDMRDREDRGYGRDQRSYNRYRYDW